MFTGKFVKEFEETTPNGNLIEGKILLNHGEFHGSLLIEKVNGKSTKQFIRGFPKIHYFDKEEHTLKNGSIFAFEKLDGTCVGIYLLKDENGDVIEHVPKSRQKAVLDTHFIEKLNLCDLRLVYKYMEFQSVEVVYFELFGMLNEHTIPHKKTYIDVRLIGAVMKYNNKFLASPDNLKRLSFELQIPTPQKFAKIEQEPDGFFHITFLDYRYTIDDTISPHIFMKTEEGVISVIKKMLDKCNRTSLEERGFLEFEGVVLQTEIENIDGWSTIKYIKIKPDSFYEAEGREKLKVPINEIRKEIQKIISENLSDFNENYDEKEVISIINENLLEEYGEEEVYHKKTRNVVERELHKYINSINDQSINHIVDEIMKKVIYSSDENPLPEMMRYFGKNYPMLKHRSSDVYFVLEKKLKRIN